MIAFSRGLLLGAVFSALTGQFATGATIAQVSGPNDLGTSFTSIVGQTAGASFSTTAGYTNVDVFLTLSAFSAAADVNLHAFLTTQVGGGTTVANEIGSAVTHIIVPASPGSPAYTLTEFQVLTGLSLSAGTYYLTFVATDVVSSGPYWISSPTADAVIVTNNASIVDPFLFAGVVAPYVPASGYGPFAGTDGWFRVTGDLQALPEPATGFAMMIGIALLGASRLRSTRRKLSHLAR